MSIGLQPGDPEFLSCLRIESSEAAIICAGNENQTSRGCNRSPQARYTSLRNSFGFQFIHDPERDFPGNFTSAHINCVESTPRGLLAWVMILIPKPGKFSPLGCPLICFGSICRLRFQGPSAPTSFTLTKRYPRDGSNEVPDQVAPPRVPGTAKVSSSPQGLNMRPGRTAPKFSRQYLFDSGVTVVISSRVMEILASGGGLIGN